MALLTGVHLTGMHLTGVYLIGVHFAGVHHRMQPFLLILVVRTWSWPDAAFLILALSDNLTLLSLGPSAAATTFPLKANFQLDQAASS
jgi:hypothetical protein